MSSKNRVAEFIYRNSSHQDHAHGACTIKVGLQTEEVIFDHLHATAFQYTPLGRTILGPAENIQKITKKDIQDYISTYYVAHRMVISASGDVKDVVEHVKKLFTKLSANAISTTQLVENEPAIFTGSEVRMKDDNMPLGQFTVAFRGASWTDPYAIALMVMLGSWNKSAGGGKHMGVQKMWSCSPSMVNQTDTKSWR